MHKFAIIGVAGFVAPKHLQAIKNIGGDLLAAFDIADSVGILDSYFPNCQFFTTLDDFKNYLNTIKIDFLVVCSPNYMHETHCRFGLENGLDVICEKPLCLNLATLRTLQEVEQQTSKKIYTILQLRLHDEIKRLKATIQNDTFYEGDLVYYTPRGNWYYKSWKGIEEKSGGIATNIGVHFFDMLCWFFGEPYNTILEHKTSSEASGTLFFENAKIHWHLSIDRQLQPTRQLRLQNTTYEFTDGFHHLHTACYEEILKGNGFTTNDVLYSTQIIEDIQG